MSKESRGWVPVGWTLLSMAVLAGCVGTDVLTTGNDGIILEAAITNQPATPYDCVSMGIDELFVRPLDGTCSPTSPLPGAPCMTGDDCNGGSCLGSKAAELIPGIGIQLVPVQDPTTTSQGKLNGNINSECNPVKQCSLSDTTPCTTTADCPNLGTCETPSGKRSAQIQLPARSIPSGLYKIFRMRFQDITLYSNGLQTPSVSCLGLTETGYTEQQLQFTIEPGVPKTVRFVVDVGALEAAVLSQTCESNTSSIVQIQK